MTIVTRNCRNLFTKQDPTPVRSPELIVLNEPLAASLGLDADALKSAEGAALLAGNEIPEGAEPLAQAYAGHQFGYFTMLGDGRAILLGEQITPQGIAWIFSSRARGGRRIPGEAMAGLLWVRCCASISLAKPCMRWAFRRPAAWRLWRPASLSPVKEICRAPS